MAVMGKWRSWACIPYVVQYVCVKLRLEVLSGLCQLRCVVPWNFRINYVVQYVCVKLRLEVLSGLSQLRCSSQMAAGMPHMAHNSDQGKSELLVEDQTH
jgi:hypothetical protein